MARTTSKSWERYGRRFLLRLSFKRPAELAVMDEFDRRSAELGKPDKEYLKLCLSVGNQILSAKALGSVSVALSNNESNNTQKTNSEFQAMKVAWKPQLWGSSKPRNRSHRACPGTLFSKSAKRHLRLLLNRSGHRPPRVSLVGS